MIRKIKIKERGEMWRKKEIPTIKFKNKFVTHLQTMASSFIERKCSEVIMSRHPVVVTKMFPSRAASSIVVTSKPK